jgi:mannose-1-phosphate guanylyltransferase
MGVLSADSLIRDRGTFERNADLAFEYAENNQALVTLGIRPRHPDTGFGYLEIGPAVAKDRRGAVHRVESFREKPDADTARHYVEMGHFLWNSGMFFWKVSMFLEALEKAAPAFASGVREIGDAYGTTRYDAVVRQVFEQWPSISVDFALMEQAENVCAVAGGFDWDDVGTWKALARTSPLDESGNVCVGKTVALDTRNCVLFNRAGREAADAAGAGSSSPSDGCVGASSRQADAGRNPLLVTLGVEDLVVVTTDDAVLVCHSDRAQDVKQLLKTLREKGHAEYL